MADIQFSIESLPCMLISESEAGSHLFESSSLFGSVLVLEDPEFGEVFHLLEQTRHHTSVYLSTFG